MGIPMTVRHVRLIEDGLWEGTLRQRDFRTMHASSETFGDVSVLVVADPSLKFDEHHNKLTLDLLRTRLVNRGETDRVIIVSGCELRRTPDSASRETIAQRRSRSSGDRRFLRSLIELPPSLREAGRELLIELRAESGGGLRYHRRSKTYVETPDNFWAVRIQPQDRSLRIVVRGEPEYFGAVTGVDLKPDRTNYSSFKVWKRSQLPAALSIIRAAQRD